MYFENTQAQVINAVMERHPAVSDISKWQQNNKERWLIPSHWLYEKKDKKNKNRSRKDIQ